MMLGELHDPLLIKKLKQQNPLTLDNDPSV